MFHRCVNVYANLCATCCANLCVSFCVFQLLCLFLCQLFEPSFFVPILHQFLEMIQLLGQFLNVHLTC